jgi:hypothetical protein
LVAVVGEDRKQGVADQRQVADEVGVAAAGFVFEPDGVLPPVVAVFNPAPVAPDELVPSGVGAASGRLAADVVAYVFVRLAVADAFAVDGDDAQGVRERGLQGVGGFDEYGALLDAAVPLFRRAVGGWLGGKGFFDRVVEVVLVAFDLEAVVAAFFNDGLGDVGNGVQAIGGDCFSVERLKGKEQFAAAV